MGIHQCPLTVRYCKWLDISSFIHILQDVLRYLGTHWHQWWYCLALVNDIHQWLVIQWLLSMFDIDPFIRMVRIVPSSFVAGEDYIICMTPSVVLQQHTSAIWECHGSTFIFHLLLYPTKQQFRFLQFTLYDPAAVSATFLLYSFTYSSSHLPLTNMYFPNDALLHID